jgi:hypothetical protein
LGSTEVEAFLSRLVNKRNVSRATQQLALSTLVFLYDKIREPERIGGLAHVEASGIHKLWRQKEPTEELLQVHSFFDVIATS